MMTNRIRRKQDSLETSCVSGAMLARRAGRRVTPQVAGWRGAPQRSQSMVEFALCAPLFLLILFIAIDVGRLIYTYSAISSAARDGARTASLQAAIYSDCQIISEVKVVGQGFPVVMDPTSLVGDSDPNNPSGTLQPSTPPPNVGYAYIWPAVATADPPDANCNSSAARAVSQTVKHVSVQISYHFIPLTPLGFASNGLIVKTVSVITTE
jgi:Flp pilus assembly protein TadG